MPGLMEPPPRRKYPVKEPDSKKSKEPYYPLCDRCGVKSAIEVVLLSGHPELVLYFCQHHYKQHKDALVAKGYEAEEL